MSSRLKATMMHLEMENAWKRKRFVKLHNQCFLNLTEMHRLIIIFLPQFPAHDLFLYITYNMRDQAAKSFQKTPVFLCWVVFPWCRRGLDWALLITGEEAVLICKPVSNIKEYMIWRLNELLKIYTYLKNSLTFWQLYLFAFLVRVKKINPIAVTLSIAY